MEVEEAARPATHGCWHWATAVGTGHGPQLSALRLLRGFAVDPCPMQAMAGHLSKHVNALDRKLQARTQAHTQAYTQVYTQVHTQARTQAPGTKAHTLLRLFGMSPDP